MSPVAPTVAPSGAPLRVLLVAALFPPYHTGAGRRFMGYVDGLRARGVELDVLSSTPTRARASAADVRPDWPLRLPGALLPSEEVGGARVRRVRLPEHGRRARTALFATAALRIIARDRPDVVLLLEHSVEFLPVVAVARILGIPTAVANTMSLTLGDAAWRRPLERRVWPLAFELADGLVVNSQEMADSLQRIGVRRRATVIPNGVPFDVFRPCADAAERVALRCSLHLSPGRRYALFVGALTRRKGPELALDAVSSLAKRHPDLDLVLAGPWLETTEPDQAAFNAELQTRLTSFGARVHRVGQTSQVAGLMRAADVLVFASSREGLPNAILEAMASECPVVTTRFAGLPDVSGPPPDALLVTERSAEALARGLDALLSDPARARAQAVAARRWVAAAHDRERTLDAYTAFFRALTARSALP